MPDIKFERSLKRLKRGDEKSSSGCRKESSRINEMRVF